MSKSFKANSPFAAALADPLFRQRIKRSAKLYTRKRKNKRDPEREAA